MMSLVDQWHADATAQRQEWRFNDATDALVRARAAGSAKKLAEREADR